MIPAMAYAAGTQKRNVYHDELVATRLVKIPTHLKGALRGRTISLFLPL